MKPMTIGRLSKAADVKVTTIRYYESIGLMGTPDRSESGQRLYGEPSVQRLSFIRHARDLGFPMEAIRDLIELQTMVVSAWASGDSASACDVKPITLFMSDGVVAVFLSKDGALHSLGTWSVNDDTLTMTHNDFPLSGSGQSKEPVNLTILELSETRFITQNADSVERKRVRCPDIEITLGHDHDGHGNH